MPGISRPFRVFLYSALIVLLCALGWTQYRTNREVTSPPEVLNPAGAGGSALVVYHPGLSDFQQRVSRAFAAGLVAGGWRVELTTANRQARTDLTRYDLPPSGTRSPPSSWRSRSSRWSVG